MGWGTLHLLNHLHQLEKTNETDLWVAPERPIREAAVTQVESGWSSDGSIADWKPEPPKAPGAPVSGHEWLNAKYHLFL